MGEVDDRVDRADGDVLDALAGDGARDPLHVLLLVDRDLELALRGVVVGQVAELDQHRRRRVIDRGRVERIAELQTDDDGADDQRAGDEAHHERGERATALLVLLEHDGVCLLWCGNRAAWPCGPPRELDVQNGVGEFPRVTDSRFAPRASLLVATPPLADPNFDRTVVYMLEHTDDGAVGVVLNRPTGDGLPDGTRPLGGPPRRHRRCCSRVVRSSSTRSSRSARLDGHRRRGRCVEPPSWATSASIDLALDPALVAEPMVQLRVFRGYSGWGPQQLDDELTEGAWMVLPAETERRVQPRARRPVARGAAPPGRSHRLGGERARRPQHATDGVSRAAAAPSLATAGDDLVAHLRPRRRR